MYKTCYKYYIDEINRKIDLNNTFIKYYDDTENYTLIISEKLQKWNIESGF